VGQPLCRDERFPRCREPGCGGSALESGSCLAHLSGGARRRYLAKLSNGGVLDVRGAVLTDVLLADVLAALRRDDGRVVVGDALFTNATFETSANFEGVVFGGVACFYKARFTDEAMFDSASFKGDAVFSGSNFLSDRSWSTFWRTRFDGAADFDGCRFCGETQFTEAVLHMGARFNGASFGRKVSYRDARIQGEALFIEATFGAMVVFEGTCFEQPPDFTRATFRSHVQLGRRGQADDSLELPSVTSERGAQIIMRRGDLILEGSTFAGPAIISGPADGAARVLSLRRTDVANVVMANVDVRPCLFAEAHNLDRLRFERVTQFTAMPNGIKTGSSWPFVWRWTDRRAIAEELQWRRENEPQWRWAGWDAEGALDGPLDENPLDPLDIARIYRALRKGREDNKDEAGASDLYYGEMEMRRKAKPPPTERAILFLFWLFSGYALRAGRALASLAVLCAAFALLFHSFGFKHPESFPRALLYSFETATRLAGGSVTNMPLSGAGDVGQLVLIILGPLLLGLALVSLRGRVRR
jgi:uncharacterized protein YjbI with pentapeptide repeats